jgi:hypothetical protein
VLSLFGKAGIIYDPGNHWTIFLHDGKHLLSHPAQHLFVAPGRVGNQVMQRLVHAANIVWGQTCSHRLYALPLAWQQQTRAVTLQRTMTIGVPRGVCQTLDICREAPLLWAWRREA